MPVTVKQLLAPVNQRVSAFPVACWSKAEIPLTGLQGTLQSLNPCMLESRDAVVRLQLSATLEPLYHPWTPEPFLRISPYNRLSWLPADRRKCLSWKDRHRCTDRRIHSQAAHEPGPLPPPRPEYS